MKIGMTGHKGLIGSFLKKRLEELGHEIVLAIDSREGLSVDVLGNLEGFEGKIDLFVHMADFCKINKTIKYPVLGHLNGVNAYHVMEFCRNNGILKVVYFSSSRVLSEERNPYTAGKIYGEELCRAYHDCYGIDYLIIRPSTVYGPFDDLTHRLVDIFIRNAFLGKDIEIYGNPKTKTLDFTYIDDFVDGVVLAMGGEWNKEYNISGGEEFGIENLAKMIIEKVGSESRIVVKDVEKAQPQNVCVDIGEIGKLGFSPKVCVEDGIGRCIEFYKKMLGK